jgi:hypothetical protein
VETPSNAQASQRWPTNDQVSGLVLLAVAVLVWWQNRAYPVGSLAEPGPGYLPLMLSIALGIIGLAVAVRGSKAPLLRTLTWPEAPRALVILTACGFAVLALERVGYRLTVFVLLVFFFGVLERRRPHMVVAVALGFALASHFIVGTLLKVQLPLSPWGW